MTHTLRTRCIEYQFRRFDWRTRRRWKRFIRAWRREEADFRSGGIVWKLMPHPASFTEGGYTDPNRPFFNFDAYYLNVPLENVPMGLNGKDCT
jgi:hypothetical protein